MAGTGRIILHPGYLPITIGSGEIRLVSASRSVVLHGNLARAVGWAMPLLARGTTEQEFLDSCRPEDRAAARAALRVLRARGFICENRESLPGLLGYQPFLPGLSGTRLEEVRSGRLVAIGTGLVADTAARIWGDAGLTVTRLQADTEIERAIIDADLAVLCPDGLLDARQGVVNQAALRADRPWIRGLACQQFAIVGPAVIPFQTACFSCYAERAKISAPDDPQIQAAVAAFSADPARDRAFCATGSAIAVLAGSMLAWEAIRLICDPASAITAGRVWCLDTATGRVDLQEVLRLPRCPACGVRGPRPNLWEFTSVPADVEPL